jgi:hypothetical protein
LQPRELVEVLRDFLGAEANRVDGGVGDVHFSTAVYTSDGGVDGRTDLPLGARQLFLPGPKTWQVKSGKAASLDDVDKPKTQQDLADGCDYALCLTGDPITPKRDEIETGLTNRIRARYPSQRAHVVTVPDLIRMAQAYPSVVQRHKGPAFMGLALEGWAPSLQTRDYPYIADDLRTRHIAAIREFALSADAAVTQLHIVGDTGVGKSRLVYEALDQDGLRPKVVIAPEFQLVNLEVLRYATEPEDSRVVIVVDDVTPAQIETLKTIAAAGRGRLRLITIGDRGADRHLIPDQARLDVAPLPAQSVQQLLGGQALPDVARELIERLAQGYPRLAVELGRALRSTPSATTTADLLSTAGVHSLLSRMIPDPSLRRSLSVLALFERFGFEQDTSSELDIIAEHFGLDRLQLRNHVRGETNRFISTVGRSRRVTPLALGVSLVRELIRPSTVVDSIVNLPEPLASAFRRQLEVLGGDPSIELVLEEVAARQAGRFRGSDGQLTEVGASFFHSLAFAAPELAARVIGEQLAGADRSLLFAQSPRVRRDLVWGLSHLLWFQPTFETAADLLLRLAEAENEDYGNNATNELAGAFQLRLGGTEVSYDVRLNWWDRNELSGDKRRRTLLLMCLDKGLDEHEIRMGNWRGARLQPKEWRPQTLGDAWSIRRALWDRLLRLARSESEIRDRALNVVERHVRALTWYRFSAELLEELLAFSGLSAKRRAPRSPTALTKLSNMTGSDSARRAPVSSREPTVGLSALT